MWWFYLIWIPIVIIYYSIYALISKKINDGYHWGWIIVLFLIQALGFWPIVAKFSKNIILDGILYDSIIVLSFYVTMIILGVANEFSLIQYIGMSIAFIGFMMLKFG